MVITAVCRRVNKYSSIYPLLPKRCLKQRSYGRIHRAITSSTTYDSTSSPTGIKTAANFWRQTNARRMSDSSVSTYLLSPARLGGPFASPVSIMDLFPDTRLKGINLSPWSTTWIRSHIRSHEHPVEIVHVGSGT